MASVDPANLDFQDLWWNREWLRCAPDTDDPEKLLEGFIYFCENYWHIRHPERGRIKFEMFEAQIETIESWLNHRYSLILKARQIGFSTLVATYAFWLTFFYSDRPVLMLSRTEREAIKLLSKAKYGYQFLPEWMKETLPRAPQVNMTQTRIEFTNASYVESLPSASDPARGESAYLIIVDEMAFLPNSEEAWSAIEPVADVGGRVIMLSTANGEGNLFHRMWVEAETGNNRFTPLFFPWSANGRTEEWYISKASDTPDWIMAQEYPSDPEEAFLKSGRPVFDLERLREIEASDPVARGYLKPNGEFVEDGGALRIWRWPVPEGVYVIGADPSQGLEHGDYASVHVINAKTHEVVAHWHGHIDPDLLGTDVLCHLGNFYNKALIVVESNNHGGTTLKFLQRTGYFPIYHDRRHTGRRPVPVDRLGFHTTQVTKPLIIDELGQALRESMILHDAETLAELRTYVRNDKGKMEGSPYDDRTISLALANYGIRFAHFAEFMPRSVTRPGTWSDWEQRVYGQTFSDLLESRSKPNKSRPPIGSFAIRSK